MSFIRLWHLAEGGVPGGLWPLLVVLAGWPLMLYRVIRPIGVFRDRSPLPWLTGGWTLALVLHLLVRSHMTLPQATALLCWPADEGDLPGSAASFARVEFSLRPAAASGELALDGKAATLLITQHLLGPQRSAAGTETEARTLMEGLGLRWLVTARSAGTSSEVLLWRFEWGQCSLDDVEAVAAPAAVPQQEMALRTLLARHVQGISAGTEVWSDEQLPLFGPVADSASLWMQLPQGELPPLAELRRSSLLVALEGAQGQQAHTIEKAIALAESHQEVAGEAWVLAGDWFARTGQWEEARQALNNALSKEANHPLIYWQLGHMAPSRLKAFGLGSRAAALQRCVDSQPAFVPAVLALGRERSLARQSSLVLPVVQRALLCYPRDAELWLLRGNLAWEIMDHLQARQAWQRSVELRPTDHRGWLNLGQQQLGLRKFERCIPLLEKAAALGSPPLVLHLLGLAHAELGQYTQARAYLERRLALGGDATELASTRRVLDRVQRESR